MSMKKKNNYPKGQGERNYTTYELESVRFIMRLFSEREGLGDGDTLVNYIHAKLCDHGLEDLNLRTARGTYVVNRYVINDFLGAAESRPNKVVVIDVLKKFIELEPTLKGYERWFNRPDTLIACGDNILKVVTNNRYKKGTHMNLWDEAHEMHSGIGMRVYRSGEFGICYYRFIPSTPYIETIISVFEPSDLFSDLRIGNSWKEQSGLLEKMTSRIENQIDYFIRNNEEFWRMTGIFIPEFVDLRRISHGFFITPHKQMMMADIDYWIPDPPTEPGELDDYSEEPFVPPKDIDFKAVTSIVDFLCQPEQYDDVGFHRFLYLCRGEAIPEDELPDDDELGNPYRRVNTKHFRFYDTFSGIKSYKLLDYFDKLLADMGK